MAVEREPGYYWIIPEKGEPPISAYWYEGVVDAFDKKSPGHFDCSNHWREDKIVHYPYQVLGPNFPPLVTPADDFREFMDKLQSSKQKLVVDAVAAGFVLEEVDGDSVKLDRYALDAFAYVPTNVGVRLYADGLAASLRDQDNGKARLMRNVRDIYAYLGIDPGAGKD
ncbi:hypothetical protein ACYPKM_01425 [Pseudomonas aeruginosa]